MKDNSGVSLLANRYASAAMREIFAPEAKIIAERKLWIAVMRTQSTLGHAISKDVITDYEKVITQVDLASIDAREKKTRHDVKARIEEFNALAGHEAIHAGMTSRDLTENIEALQIRKLSLFLHDLQSAQHNMQTNQLQGDHIMFQPKSQHSAKDLHQLQKNYSLLMSV
jgi:adenylosuccinate lyase